MSDPPKSTADRNIDKIYEGLSTDYTHALHSRESYLEAVIMSARYTATLTPRQNEMLAEAVRDGRFSTCMGFTLPASVFVGGTFSTHRSGRTGVDMYSTFLPKPSDEALRKKTEGGIGKYQKDTDGDQAKREQDQNTKHTHDYANYVSGDPKNINMPMQQASSLLHMFFALQFIGQKYHEKISLGEEGINMIINKYKELVQKVMACTGVGNDTWSTILDEYDGRTGNVPPWNPFFVEEIMDEHNKKRVVSYRFLIFMNKHLGPNIQPIFNAWVDELRDRLAYNSEVISEIKEVCSNNKKAPQPGHAGRGGGAGGGANLAAAAAAPQADELSIHRQKMAKLTERVKSDYLEVARVWIGTQVRSWEIPLIELIKDPYQSYINGSTVLAKCVRTLLAAGDNIAMPRCQQKNPDAPNDDGDNMDEDGADYDANSRFDAGAGVYSIGHDKVDTSGRFINAFARNPSQRASVVANVRAPPSSSALLSTKKYSRPTIGDLITRVGKTSYLISQQKHFRQCYYLPAAIMQPYESGRTTNPMDDDNPTDPRRVEHLFHVLNTFSSFACTSADPKQLNPHAYFDLDDGEQYDVAPEDTPAYVVTSPNVPQHARWHSLRDNRPSITYGGLVNLIPEAYGIPFVDMHRRFKGFPKEVVARGNVTIMWPTCQPWEFGMVPLPELVRSVEMFQYTRELIRGMALNENGNYTQFLDSHRLKDPLSIACLYMTTVMSTETLLIDSQKTPHPIGQLPIVTEIDSNTRRLDMQCDTITIPESCQTLGTIFNEASRFLTRRIQAARMNITFNHKIPTRLAYETGQPVVRQPTDPIDGQHNAMTALDRETFVLGMDVYHYGGDANGAYLGLVEVMCGSVSVTETFVTALTDQMIEYGVNDAARNEEEVRPRRLDTNRLLTADIEELALRLLCYTKNVPDVGFVRDPKMLSFSHLVSKPMPTLSLPMSVPISAIFDEFNRRTTSDKWSNFCVNMYTNTSPLEEMVSYLATLGVVSFKIYSGIDTFLICDVCVSSSTRYNISMNSPHLHLLLVGETATSKSYIYKIMRKLATPGLVMGTNEGSSKANKTHTNFNGQLDIRDEAPDFLTINPDKSAGRNSKQGEQLEEWKDQADAGLTSYTFQDGSDPSGRDGGRNANKVLFRRKGLAVSLCNGVIMYSMNKGVDSMQNAVRERTLIINPPINNDSGKSLPGSQLSDYALHNIDAFSNLKPTAMRSRHSWITLMHLYARLNPRFSPDIYDASNLIGQVLRTAKQFLPRNIHETRMYGRFWAFLTELVFMNAHHMVMRDEMDNRAKYAPCEHGSGYLSLRHLSVEEFMSRANKYLYATKGMAIITLTLLKDILESPIRTAILEYLAEKCYPDGNVNFTTFKKIDPNGGGARKKKGGPGAPDPADDKPIQTDFNTVVWSSTYTDLDTLFRELGKKIGGHVSYSTEQVRYVFFSMRAETVETLAADDLNREKYPLKVVGYTARASTKKAAAKGSGGGGKKTANKKSVSVLKGNPEMAAALGQWVPNYTTNTLASDDKSNDGSSGVTTRKPEAMEVDKSSDDNEDPEVERLDAAPRLTAEEVEQVNKWRDTVRCTPADAPFTRSVLSLEKSAVIGGSVSSFYHIHVPHILLREYYREKKNGNEKIVDPFHRSHVWKAIASTLQNNALEKYPEFITDAIAASEQVSPNGKDYFNGGQYTYLTGRTDATNSKAEKYIKAAQKEIDAVFASADIPDSKTKRSLPHILPTRWPAESPVLQRNGRISHLALPCIIDDTDVDRTYIYGPSVNFGAPKSIEFLKYDIDYISMLRRCMRLGLDVKDVWESLPIVCKVKKSMDGAIYPETSYKMSIDGMKQSIISDIQSNSKLRSTAAVGDESDEAGGDDSDGDGDFEPGIGKASAATPTTTTTTSSFTTLAKGSRSTRLAPDTTQRAIPAAILAVQRPPSSLEHLRAGIGKLKLTMDEEFEDDTNTLSVPKRQKFM